jgi:magnesium chelatase family protein
LLSIKINLFITYTFDYALKFIYKKGSEIMFAKVTSCSVFGINGYIVNVEIDISNGLPMFNIVGLGDTAISESRERVKSAIKNSGFDMLPKRVVVNLSPADLKKEGTSFDLPVAVSLLSAYGYLKNERAEEFMIVGELSLDGKIKKVDGIINSVITAKENGIKGIILPYENRDEAAIIKGIEIYPVKSLRECINFLNMEEEVEKFERVFKPKEKKYEIDFKDVKGQEKAKRGMEIAAAGGHNFMMIGSPGAGKSMLAKRIVTILPKLTEEEMIESTKIYSISGLLGKKNPVVDERPFRSPHHTSSDVAIIGGGRFPKPGEITLSHNGVLFLDEFGEFSKSVIEVLRQPLEDKVITVSRALTTVEFPADFILVAASNPCPCGYLYEDDTSVKSCVCSQNQIQNYQKKISGPILDRMDMYIEIKKVPEEKLFKYGDGESSEEIRRRVEEAREVQRKRYGKNKTNSQMTQDEMKEHAALNSGSEEIMKNAARNLGLSGRGFDKILKVARTIADLEGSKNIEEEHLIEALGYRKM